MQPGRWASAVCIVLNSWVNWSVAYGCGAIAGGIGPGVHVHGGLFIDPQYGRMVATWGSADVQAQWLGDLAAGRKFASYCLTEANAGSDAASIKTSAQRFADHYVINGAKAFIGGAGDTDVLVIVARTGGSGPGGISAFVVPSDTPGVSFGKNETKMGWNSQATRAITFEDARIPAVNRLGEGEGFAIAMRVLKVAVLTSRRVR